MKSISIIIILLFVIVYLLPLGVRPLVIPDETRYAQIAREMLESGDWIVPRLAQTRYFEKPVLGYWFTAAAIKLFGENNFAVRLPSALAVGISALMIYLLIYKFAGGKKTSVFLRLACF
jgi:4-amino-4-deoxy-L-arabinose transferase